MAGAAGEWSLDRLSQSARRLTWVLFAAQSMSSAGFIAAATLASILGAELAGSAAWAGVPSSVYLLGTAGAALAWGYLMDVLGRRGGLVLGLVLGALGGGLAFLAVDTGSFLLFLVGLALMGVASAAVTLGRFAAAEVHPPAERGRALSTVVLGGTVGAVLGPLLVGPAGRWAESLGRRDLSGAYAVSGSALPACGGGGVRDAAARSARSRPPCGGTPAGRRRSLRRGAAPSGDPGRSGCAAGSHRHGARAGRDGHGHGDHQPAHACPRTRARIGLSGDLVAHAGDVRFLGGLGQAGRPLGTPADDRRRRRRPGGGLCAGDRLAAGAAHCRWPCSCSGWGGTCASSGARRCWPISSRRTSAPGHKASTTCSSDSPRPPEAWGAAWCSPPWIQRDGLDRGGRGARSAPAGAPAPPGALGTPVTRMNRRA